MVTKAVILLPKRSSRDLSGEEKAAVQAVFPGKEIEWQRIDWIHDEDYVSLCRKRADHDAILLTHTFVVPRKAFRENDLRHLVVVPNHGLRRVRGQFMSFVDEPFP